MNLKEKYARFKAWQQQPFSYEYKSYETQHCLNCDHDFTGNFCPYCSQKAGVGKVSWSSAKESVLEVWGVGNRSMTYSIWQLLWRPGYFVGDYISGRKQVSFPPVKMLLIVAVIVTLMEHLLGVESSEVTTDREYDFVALAAAWFQHNIGWGMLAANSLFLLPIWILFRFAPRNTRLSLPAGFFLQVFISVLILVLNLISDFFTDWFAILVPLYYYVTCRQLFGYGRWATIWRLLIMAVVAIMTVVTIVLTLEYLVRRGLVLHQEIDAGEIASIICAIAVAVVLLLAGFLISWWRYKRKEKHLLSIKSIDYVRKDETTPRPDSERDS